MNLSVLNRSKVAFLMNESQKVASNLFTIRTCFKLYSSLLKCIYFFFPTETNQLCLRVTACISYRVMCFRFGQCSSLKRSILESFFFKPKMDLISTITVFGFLEIQSNDVPVDDKPSVRCILNQINKTYTCTCLGYEFCFQQHNNVTRQSYFFKPLSTYLRLNENPGCQFFLFIFFNNQLLFSLGTVLMFNFQR